ncbi:hypothetical protein MAUB1S_06582 [Mycolicibacterium aubagnense]
MEAVTSALEFLFYVGYGLIVLTIVTAFFIQLLRGKITLRALRTQWWWQL